MPSWRLEGRVCRAVVEENERKWASKASELENLLVTITPCHHYIFLLTHFCKACLNLRTAAALWWDINTRWARGRSLTWQTLSELCAHTECPERRGKEHHRKW